MNANGVPNHVPAALRTVVETPAFLRDAEKAGVTEVERNAIVVAIAANPDQGDEVQGSGGVRKLRAASRGKGKSGGYRVMVVYLGADAPAYLLALLSKGERANFSPTEIAVMRHVTTAIKQARRERTVR